MPRVRSPCHVTANFHPRASDQRGGESETSSTRCRWILIWGKANVIYGVLLLCKIQDKYAYNTKRELAWKEGRIIKYLFRFCSPRFPFTFISSEICLEQIFFLRLSRKSNHRARDFVCVLCAITKRGKVSKSEQVLSVN